MDGPGDTRTSAGNRVTGWVKMRTAGGLFRGFVDVLSLFSDMSPQAYRHTVRQAAGLLDGAGARA